MCAMLLVFVRMRTQFRIMMCVTPIACTPTPVRCHVRGPSVHTDSGQVPRACAVCVCVCRCSLVNLAGVRIPPSWPLPAPRPAVAYPVFTKGCNPRGVELEGGPRPLSPPPLVLFGAQPQASRTQPGNSWRTQVGGSSKLIPDSGLSGDTDSGLQGISPVHTSPRALVPQPTARLEQPSGPLL